MLAVTESTKSVSLRKSSQGWEFASEQALEEFVWNHIDDLLHVRPFKRQLSVMGEVCDILALTAERQLVIIELKNTEYRHVVQQLTRYYSNLLSERPFSDAIDYEKSVRLIAIAPSFHRHNYIDRQYSRLSFEFIEARVKKSEQFYLQLKSEGAEGIAAQVILPYKEPEIGDHYDDLTEVPEQLVKWIGGCSVAEQQSFLRTRAQILRFDSRIQEIVGTKSIQYGTGKTKLCAEICFSKRLQRPVLFLWLTLPTSWKSSGKAERTGRLRMWLHNGELTDVGHVTTGLGKMRLEEEWDAIPKKRWPRQALHQNLSHRSHIPIGVTGYFRLVFGIENSTDYLETCVSMALQKWLEKQ